MSNEEKELALAFLDCMRRVRRNHMSDVYQTLTSVEFSTLFSILKLQEQKGSPRVSDLVEDLNASPQFISKTLRTLETKGYCERMTDPANRRSTLVLLTEKGTDLLHTAKDRIFRFAQAVTERMGQEDMEEFIRLNHKCFDIVQDIASELYTEKEEHNE